MWLKLNYDTLKCDLNRFPTVHKVWSKQISFTPDCDWNIYRFVTITIMSALDLLRSHERVSVKCFDHNIQCPWLVSITIFSVLDQFQSQYSVSLISYNHNIQCPWSVTITIFSDWSLKANIEHKINFFGTIYGVWRPQGYIFVAFLRGFNICLGHFFRHSPFKKFYISGVGGQQ